MSIFNTRWAKGKDFDRLIANRVNRVGYTPNRKALSKHLDLRLLNGKKASTVGADAELLARWANHLGAKPFLKAKEADFITYFRTMQADEYEPTTMYHHFVVIRTYYRETTGLEKPPQLGRFKVKRAVAERLTIKDVIEPDEMVRILSLFQGPVERAALTLMYECGLRRGELFSLRVRSIEVDDARLAGGEKGVGGEMWLHVLAGKTGPRSIIAFPPADAAIRNLMQNRGGAPSDPEAPLLMHHTRSLGWAVIDEAWVNHVMDRIRSAKVTHKAVWPHLLRHSCATNMARRGEQEADMRAYLGWAYDSDMPAYYTHLATSDHQRGWKRSRGIVTSETRKPVGLQPRVCGNCAHHNAPTADYCEKCNRPVSIEAAARAKLRTRQETVQLVQEALRSANISEAGLAGLLTALNKAANLKDAPGSAPTEQRDGSPSSPAPRSTQGTSNEST